MSEAHEVEYGVVGEFPYSIWETHMGSLCGYLGLPASNPWYGLRDEWLDDEKPRLPRDLDVHGGITFTQFETKRRRHALVEDPDAFMGKRFDFWDEDRPDGDEPYPHDTGMNLWWIGFDCAHAGDLVPGIREALGEVGFDRLTDEVYRDRDYVMKEIEGLATQAADAVRATA